VGESRQRAMGRAVGKTWGKETSPTFERERSSPRGGGDGTKGERKLKGEFCVQSKTSGLSRGKTNSLSGHLKKKKRKKGKRRRKRNIPRGGDIFGPRKKPKSDKTATDTEKRKVKQSKEA